MSIMNHGHNRDAGNAGYGGRKIQFARLRPDWCNYRTPNPEPAKNRRNSA